LKIIYSHFKGNLTSDAYIEEISKAPAYLPYDSKSIFKSLEHLELNFQDPVETSPSPFPFPLVHHIKSSSSDSLTPFPIGT